MGNARHAVKSRGKGAIYEQQCSQTVERKISRGGKFPATEQFEHEIYRSEQPTVRSDKTYQRGQLISIYFMRCV